MAMADGWLASQLATGGIERRLDSWIGPQATAVSIVRRGRSIIGEMTDKPASRTAVLVCQGRAVADGRLAADPSPIRLRCIYFVTTSSAAVRTARAPQPPAGWWARLEFEMLNATAAVLAARTVVIDDAVP